MKYVKKVFTALFLAFSIWLGTVAQIADHNDALSVTAGFIDAYFNEYPRKIGDLSVYGTEDMPLIYIVNLMPEGWILISGNMGASPVIGFNYTGSFVFPEVNKQNPAYNWLKQSAEQIEELYSEPAENADPRWAEGYEYKEAKSDLTVNPLISVEWGQGEGWNQFCPEDPEGPGGNALVGCVAVAMAQAMSVFELPDIGVGSISYEHDVYGTIANDFTQSVYRWDLMSDTEANEHSALFLYDCATSVEMNFGPSSSSATTNLSPAAMAINFSMSWSARYLQRTGYTTETWVEKIKYELRNGRPLIYKGRSDDNTSGHAFNVDGVVPGDLFHINWGWSGKSNGYFLIDALNPGSRSYNFSQAAVFNIMPNATPVDIYEENEEFIIYPNPVSSVLRFDKMLPDNLVSVRLFSLNGNLLKYSAAASLTGGMDVSDLSKGSYILEIVLKDRRIIHRRIIKL
jgi:hypothetical protein